jgi:phosphoketolase
MERTTEVSDEILAPLTPDELRKIDAYWHAYNYLAAGMIYLRGESSASRALEAGAHQESASWPLGVGSGTVFDLDSSKPPHQEI